jgi:hypothetical protein
MCYVGHKTVQIYAYILYFKKDLIICCSKLKLIYVIHNGKTSESGYCQLYF